MQNIRAIQDHFSPIIIGGLNETEILLIIQSNYDDLKLRILGMRFLPNVMVKFRRSLSLKLISTRCNHHKCADSNLKKM